MREVHTVTVTGEAPWSNRTVDPLRVNRDGTVWSDIVLPGHWVNLLRHTSFSVACNAQRTYRYASRCRLPRASSGSQLDPVPPAPKFDLVMVIWHDRHDDLGGRDEQHDSSRRPRAAHRARERMRDAAPRSHADRDRHHALAAASRCHTAGAAIEPAPSRRRAARDDERFGAARDDERFGAARRR